MSMHKIPLTFLEVTGLIKHKLPTLGASQLSDCFRLGVAWALNKNEDNVTLGDEVYIYNLKDEYYPVKFISNYSIDGLSSIVELSDGTFDIFDTAAVFQGSLKDKNNHVTLAKDYHKRINKMLKEKRTVLSHKSLA